MKRSQSEDLQLLAQAFFDNLVMDNCEFGGIGVDSKRPFGNSFVEGDILEIIEWDPEDEDDGYSEKQLEYARDLYLGKLIPYLKKNCRPKSPPKSPQNGT